MIVTYQSREEPSDEERQRIKTEIARMRKFKLRQLRITGNEQMSEKALDLEFPKQRKGKPSKKLKKRKF